MEDMAADYGWSMDDFFEEDSAPEKLAAEERSQRQMIRDEEASALYVTFD